MGAMMKKITFSIDVEKDLHDGGERGIKCGLLDFEKMCYKYKINPTLFVVGNLVKKHAKLLKRLHKKGWDISLHGFSHKRFDEMRLDEKKKEIENSLWAFKKYLGIKPKGFRAPQHSIDNETLDLLEENGFEYDSSYAPLNLFQLLFFPSKFKLWFKLFFSRLNKYRIRKNLYETPTSSILIPFVSLTARVFPKWMLKPYILILGVFYKNPVFYAHSWDFVKLPESKIDRIFSHERFKENLDYIMSA
jgi:hypothetical protein